MRLKRRCRKKHPIAPDGELYLTQILALLSVSRATFYRWVSMGKMPAPRWIAHDQRAVYSADEIQQAMRHLSNTSAGTAFGHHLPRCRKRLAAGSLDTTQIIDNRKSNKDTILDITLRRI